MLKLRMKKMKLIANTKLDFFENKIFPESVQGEKIRLLEEKQEKLRRGLFKRWNTQEQKINALSENIYNILKILKIQE